MKNTLLITLLITYLISSNAIANPNKDKEKDEKPALLIVNLGTSLSYFNQSDSKTKANFSGGFQKDVRIVPMFRLNTGLFMNSLGGYNNSTRQTTNLNYLQLPVGIKFKIGPLYAITGVSGSYRVASKQGGNSLPSSATSKIDYGTHVGLGFKFLMFSLEGRYNWGLKPINSETSEYFPESNTRNRYWQLFVGIHIPRVLTPKKKAKN